VTGPYDHDANARDTGRIDRAMTLGAELHRVNAWRNRRARLMASNYWLGIPPSGQARFIFDLALVDERRRALRDLLADQLGEVEATAVPPRADPWPGPRHAGDPDPAYPPAGYLPRHRKES
jgi:hypothetical protein